MNTIKPNDLISYDDFVSEAWDYVSEKVVSDQYWENNFDFIQECTFDMYNFYSKKIKNVTTEGSDNPVFVEGITVKECGKILESMFSNIIRFQQIV